jgi:hypothetical protein
MGMIQEFEHSLDYLSTEIDSRFTELTDTINTDSKTRQVDTDEHLRAVQASFLEARFGSQWQNELQFRLQYCLGHTAFSDPRVSIQDIKSIDFSS